MARKIKPKKYWQGLENTISEVNQVIKEHELDTLPTQKKLRELGYSSLDYAITKHHGGLSNFRELLGEELLKKPNGYWTLENTISESKKVMKEHNYDKLPSSRKLTKLGYSSLAISISKYHGGFPSFKKKYLSEEVSRKPGGYYTLENTISEAKKIMEEQGVDRLPSQNKLEELGYSSLNHAINRHHGGMNNFRKKYFGEELLIKPMGYWENLETTIFEAKEIMKENNFDTFPSGEKLKKLGYGGLVTAIHRHHGGMNNFREKHLGEKPLTKPDGYWKLETTIFEAKEVMKEHNLDRLPSGNKLQELGYSGLSAAISRSYGGFHNFREIMNQELGIKSKEEHLTELVEDYLKD